jgi:hypothetical protein
MPRKLPALTASQMPTQRTVEPAATSKTSEEEVAFDRPDAAAQVAALRAYAGEPPVNSFVPVEE